jgi:hypothetical protein
VTVLIANSPISTSRISAGDKKKPVPPAIERGPEYKVLEALVGTYDAKVKVLLDPQKPQESTAVMKRTMILDGLFLQESYQGKFFGKAFTGTGLIGWDPTKKRYTNAWCDNFNPVMTVLQGTWDAEKKTMTMVGDDYAPALKKKMKARDVLKVISADEQFFAMFRQAEGSDKEMCVMEITYKRRAERK